jgi:hypothetical protein
MILEEQTPFNACPLAFVRNNGMAASCRSPVNAWIIFSLAQPIPIPGKVGSVVTGKHIHGANGLGLSQSPSESSAHGNAPEIGFGLEDARTKDEGPGIQAP